VKIVKDKEGRGGRADRAGKGSKGGERDRGIWDELNAKRLNSCQVDEGLYFCLKTWV